MANDAKRAVEALLRHQGLDVSASALDAAPSPGESWDPLQFWMQFADVRRQGPAAPLFLSRVDFGAMATHYPGFSPRYWDSHVLRRAWLMTTIPEHQTLELIRPLIDYGDLREQQAVYRGLPLVVNADAFGSLVALGVRTNILDVFQAIALGNPLPARLLDAPAWAQVVLKAIFMDQPLYRIHQLDARRSPELALTAVDFASERWAAGRHVHPELWRLVQGIDHPDVRAALRRAAEDEDPLTARAAALATREALDPTAWRELGETYEITRASIDARQVLYPAPLNNAPKEAL